MSDWDVYRTPTVINSFTSFFPISMAHVWNLSLNSAAVSWGTANQAVYLPFVLPWEYPIARVFWVNGSTTTGNGCAAIYTPGGKQLYTTGSVARTPASGLQWTNLSTPLILPPGAYYFGLSINATTTAVFGSISVTAAIARGMGIKQQASALPLPDPATFAAPTTAVYPLCGFSRRGTP